MSNICLLRIGRVVIVVYQNKKGLGASVVVQKVELPSTMLASIWHCPESWLLYFSFSVPLMCLGRQGKMA